MSDVTTISVDGQAGESGAQDDALALAVVDIQNNPLLGRDGRNAAKALPGGPGGHLAVMLNQSSVTDGGISVQIVENGSDHQLPPTLEVSPNRIIRVSARGGNGQPGGIGGNGEDGKPGADGADATRTVDATNGSQGGNGGNAGAGSSGGDGGDGGTIEIQVLASMTHLLFAAEWDTRGGHGGVDGVHGNPGEGGPGGQGGGECRWEEHIGYSFTCTPECVGFNRREHRQSMPPVHRMLEWGRESSSRELDLTKPQEIHGQNMALLVNSIASRHIGFSRQANAPMGTCKCAGGGGNCISCKRTELNSQMVRPQGRNGAPGERGSFAPPISLFSGMNGADGVGHIKVFPDPGTGTIAYSYGSRYRLELVNFEIQDENHDGVFEPGECVVIQHIRIKNSGGMPSPGCPIPITVMPTKWIEPLEDQDGTIFLSQSIPAGESVTLSGEFKAWIKTPETVVKVGTPFREVDAISIKATMPWINQTIDHFTFKRSVIIEYPLQLTELNILKSLVPSSKNKFTMGILNKSLRTYGASTPTKRKVEVTLCFPSDRGALLSRGLDWDNTNTKEVAVLAPKLVSKSQQFIGVTSGAEINSIAKIRVCLYLSLPEAAARAADEEWDAPDHLQLIEQTDVIVKISPQFDFNDDASFLLITNPGTPNTVIEAIKNFIEVELKLKLDQWNLGQHGGLEYPREDPDDEPKTVISSYAKKSIIFLGNNFEYFSQGERNVLQLCDIEEIAESCLNGTTGLFLGFAEKKHYDILGSFVFPVTHRLQDPSAFIKDATHFTAKKELLQAISQQKTVGGSRFTTFTLLVTPSLRGGTDGSTRKEAETIVEDLRSLMPQDRFLVSHIYPLSSIMDDTTSTITSTKGKLLKGDRNFGLVVVYRGLPHSRSICMAIPRPVRQVRVQLPPEQESQRFSSLGQVRDRPMTKSAPDHFDAYMIVSSLPLHDRVSILFSSVNTYSPFIQDSCELSTIVDFFNEVSLLLISSPILDSLKLKKLSDSDILALHFSGLAVLIKHPCLKSCDTIPDRVLRIFHCTLAAAYPTRNREKLSSQRTQVRNFITKVVDEVLRRKGLEDSVMEFHAAAKKEATTVRTEIKKEISRITKMTEHEYISSRMRIGDVVKQTMYCKSRDWDLMVGVLEKWKKEREEGLKKAREILGEMTAL